MEQLDMIKAFAALDGVYIDRIENDVLYHLGEYGCMKPFNPITDLALNCAARDKYEVEVNYSTYSAINFCNSQGDISECHFKTKADIGHAIIECILKSTGKWV